MRMVWRQITALALAASLFVTAGCQQGTGIGPEGPDLSSVTEFFDLLVDPGTSDFRTFQVPKTEYVQVTLVALSTEDPRQPLSVPMHLRLGRSTGTDCNELVGGSHTPGFRAQLGSVLEAGIYCVELIDIGNLPVTTGALVRVVHPAPWVLPMPQTLTSNSIITAGGSFTRTFEATAPGGLVVTLTDLQPNVEVGLGVGMDYDSEVGCRLSQVIRSTARSTPHFNLQVDPGDYCVQVFDIGNFTQTTTFALTIQHP
jgi:hypothetical protein